MIHFNQSMHLHHINPFVCPFISQTLILGPITFEFTLGQIKGFVHTIHFTFWPITPRYFNQSMPLDHSGPFVSPFLSHGEMQREFSIDRPISTFFQVI
jgi:hypothetical protein